MQSTGYTMLGLGLAPKIAYIKIPTYHPNSIIILYFIIIQFFYSLIINKNKESKTLSYRYLIFINLFKTREKI